MHKVRGVSTIKKMGQRLPQTLSEEEFGKIIKAAYKEEHKIAFQLGFFCGLRVSEVVKLREEHIDKTRQQLFIKEGKGSKDRYVPYPKRLSSRLKYIPLNFSNTRSGIRSLQIAFKKAKKRAGITKDVKFHSLRHSCATLWIRKGKSVKHVQQLLGHTNLSTTSIYLHVTPEDLKKEMDDIWG